MMFQGWSRQARASALFTCLALSIAACGADPASSTDSDDESSSEGTKRDAGSASSSSGSSSSGSSSKDSGSKADAGSTKTDAGTKADAGASGGGSGSSEWCAVKAVFAKNCVSCHDGEGTAGAPMGLTSFADTQDAAPITKGKKVYETVGTRMHDTKKPMPPKGLLGKDDLAAVDAWIKAGAKGDDADCSGDDKSVEGQPQALTWPAECTEANRFKLTAKATVAKGTETHPQFFFDAPWGAEERQMLALRNITDNRKVLHHWILYSSAGAFITGWAPSDDNKKSPLPDDVGMYLPSGARSLRLDMHYFNLQGTQDEQDASGVEVCAVPKAQWRKNTATVTMSFASLGQGFVLAPANRMNYESTGTCRITAREPVHVLTASPHAHTLAKAMRFTVTRANGEKITMHEGPFNFEEQGQISMKNELILNTGDTVTTTCIYDNPTSRNVTFGESTTNEMCFNFALYYPMNSFSCGFL